MCLFFSSWTIDLVSSFYFGMSNQNTVRFAALFNFFLKNIYSTDLICPVNIFYLGLVVVRRTLFLAKYCFQTLINLLEYDLCYDLSILDELSSICFGFYFLAVKQIPI